MQALAKRLTDSLYPDHDSDDLSLEKIVDAAENYPYFSVLQLLKARMLEDTKDSKSKFEVSRASLYFQNPHWFDLLITHDDDDLLPQKLAELVPVNKIDEPVIEPTFITEKTEAVNQEIHEQPTEDTSTSIPELTFEPLHTIDYFASQGIKVTADFQDKDQISVKLKSFTEWLKSMKKIHPEKLPEYIDSESEKSVRESAEFSNTHKGLYTESLANIYAKQGLKEKAIEIFEKLSLIEPSKSAYFADRINELKEL